MLRFDIVGAGKVGKNFAKFLATNGHEIGHVVNSSLDSSKKAVKFIGQGIPTTIDKIGKCDVLLIGTRDDDIRQTFLKILSISKEFKAIGHFSGAYSSLLLRECDQIGIGRFSIHPNASFADPEIWKAFFDIYFVIEGNERGKELIKNLLLSLKLKFGEISASKKLFYHAGAVFASNFMVALLSTSRELYTMSGLDQKITIEISNYLAKQAIENVEKLGLKKAITGPVARGDMQLVHAEEMALEDFAPKIGLLYRKFVEVLKERVIEVEREKIDQDER